MLQKVYLNTQKTMVYKICVVSCKYEILSTPFFGQLRKKGPSSFDNYDNGLSVHICGFQQNQITCSNIYNCILKFCEMSNNYQ